MTQNRQTVVALAGIAAGALVIRVAAIVAISSFLLEHVTYEHGEIARNLVEGRGFSVRWMGGEGPTSTQAPIYPALLAACYRAFGIQSPQALLGMQLFQAVLGALLVLSIVGLAWELLPQHRIVGWLVGLSVAIYPTLVYAVTQIQVVSLATLLVVLALYSAARAARLSTVRAAVMCGLVCGLLVLTDPILWLVVAVALGMLARTGASDRPGAASAVSPALPLDRRGLDGGVVRRVDSARLAGCFRSVSCWPGCRLRLPAVTGTVCVALAVPWISRNYSVHGEFVPIKSTFGYAFWQGNHPRSWGTDKIPLPRTPPGKATELPELERALWHARLVDTLYIDDAVLPNQRIAELGQFPEPERSRRLMSEALGYIRQNPGGYVRLCLQRLRYFLWYDPTNPKSVVPIYRLGHALLIGMALAGLWASRSFWRQLWPTYLVFTLVTLFHAFTIVSVRFRIPLEPLALLWGACAVSWVIERCASGLARRSNVAEAVSNLASAQPSVG